MPRGVEKSNPLARREDGLDAHGPCVLALLRERGDDMETIALHRVIRDAGQIAEIDGFGSRIGLSPSAWTALSEASANVAAIRVR